MDLVMAKTINVVPMKLYKPDPRECAMLFLKLVDERVTRRGKEMTRAQISEGSLKRLWKRERFSDQFLEEVQDWLLSTGWALFYAGGVYGAVKTDAVGNWPTLASSRIASLLNDVARGKFEFDALESLLSAGSDTAKPEEEAPHDEADDG
jgi:hypothetical protein